MTGPRAEAGHGLAAAALCVFRRLGVRDTGPPAPWRFSLPDAVRDDAGQDLEPGLLHW